MPEKSQEMNPTMTFKDYCGSLSGRENDPASLKALLGPFKIDGLPSQEDEFLMIGHVIDAIASEQSSDSMVDAASVLEMALDLGLTA